MSINLIKKKKKIGNCVKSNYHSNKLIFINYECWQIGQKVLLDWIKIVFEILSNSTNARQKIKIV